MPITIVDYPTKLPAKCLNCGSPYGTDGRKFLDLHLDVLRYGRLYLCTHCFAEAAELAGYVHVETYEHERQVNDELHTIIKELEDENGDLRTALRSLGVLGIVPRRTEDEYNAEEGEGITIDNLGRTDQGSTSDSSTGKRSSKNTKSGSVESNAGNGSQHLPESIQIKL